MSTIKCAIYIIIMSWHQEGGLYELSFLDGWYMYIVVAI